MAENILLVLLFFLPWLTTPLSPPNPTALSSGQAQYQELSLKASLPKYGPCWLSSLSRLSSTCTHLSEETQARLALQFTNCFLIQAGQKDYPCKEEEDIAMCLQDVDNNAFTAYSNFYTHTQNMCYFLKSQEWQEITDNTIQKLSSSSARVAQEMEVSINLHKEILVGQQDSLEYQRQLAVDGSQLSKAIEASKSNVRSMLEEFKMSTNEQKHLIFEVFDRVTRLQNIVVSEVSWLYTVVFYSASLLIIYLVTATRRTEDSRLWLFLILSLNFGLERFVIFWSLPEDGENIAIDLSQIVNDRVWMVRNISIFISILVLVVMTIKFKDLNLINNCLLEEIKRQNQELKRSMETFQVDNKMSHDIRPSVDTLDGHFVPLSDMWAEDTGYIDDEDVSDDDSDSFNSTRTDRTFDPSNHDASHSDDDYGTAKNSRETTPTNQVMNTIDMAMEALNSSLVHSTPAKENILGNLQSQSRPATPSSRYNLRSRSRLSSPLDTTVQESPREFAMQVKKQLGRSKRNYSKWKMAVKKQEGEFSDD